MSEEKLLAEFEAWWESDGQYCRAGGGDYEKTFAWRAWEASRAAVVIELPAIEAWDNDGLLDREKGEDAAERIGLVPRIEVRTSIEATGVRVK